MTEFITTSLIIQCAQNALAELAGILPLLFIVFLIIEFIEYYYFDKISRFAKCTGAFGPFAGALLASFPQCGFSIIASALYIKGLITKGTLIAVYISTSDEAIPVLLSDTQTYKFVLPVILTKILVGIIAGYTVDFLFPSNKKPVAGIETNDAQKGCCEHNITRADKKDLILHPIKHTVIISVFIFLITFFINIFFLGAASAEHMSTTLLGNSAFCPLLAAIFGLVPNCAVSVAFVLLLIKGVITFPCAIAGLCSNAGLGILVLLSKNDNKKDSTVIILSLVIISALAGTLLSHLIKLVNILSSF